MSNTENKKYDWLTKFLIIVVSAIFSDLGTALFVFTLGISGYFWYQVIWGSVAAGVSAIWFLSRQAPMWKTITLSTVVGFSTSVVSVFFLALGIP